MSFFSFKGISPKIIESVSCWFAPNAKIIGDVTIFPNVSIWFGSVIRGDNEGIVISKNSNIQENSILHTDKGYPLQIEQGCTIGHASILHGCRIGPNTLIGMGSTILNGAEVGKNCIIGAGSLVVQNQLIPDGSLVIGRPGKIIRKLSKTEINLNKNAAAVYQAKITDYRNSFHLLDQKDEFS